MPRLNNRPINLYKMQKRKKISFTMLIIIGLIIGLLIKRVALGLVIGLVLGLLASGLVSSGKNERDN